MPSANVPSYVRFLKTLTSLHAKNPCKDLDATEINLLHFVLVANGTKERILVGDLLRLSQYGSQATLHAKIKSLVSKGLFVLQSNSDDGRQKFVIPSKVAHKYSSFMSDCLAKAAKSKL